MRNSEDYKTHFYDSRCCALLDFCIVVVLFRIMKEIYLLKHVSMHVHLWLIHFYVLLPCTFKGRIKSIIWKICEQCRPHLFYDFLEKYTFLEKKIRIKKLQTYKNENSVEAIICDHLKRIFHEQNLQKLSFKNL